MFTWIRKVAHKIVSKVKSFFQRPMVKKIAKNSAIGTAINLFLNPITMMDFVRTGIVTGLIIMEAPKVVKKAIELDQRK